MQKTVWRYRRRHLHCKFAVRLPHRCKVYCRKQLRKGHGNVAVQFLFLGKPRLFDCDSGNKTVAIGVRHRSCGVCTPCIYVAQRFAVPQKTANATFFARLLQLERRGRFRNFGGVFRAVGWRLGGIVFHAGRHCGKFFTATIFTQRRCRICPWSAGNDQRRHCRVQLFRHLHRYRFVQFFTFFRGNLRVCTKHNFFGKKTSETPRLPQNETDTGFHSHNNQFCTGKTAVMLKEYGKNPYTTDIFFDFYSAVATCQNAIKHIFKKHLHKKRQCNAMLHCLHDICFSAVFVKCVNTIKHNFPKAFALENQFNQHCTADRFLYFLTWRFAMC